MPAFVSEMAFGSGPLQFLARLEAEGVVAGIEKRYIVTEDLLSVVAVNARCSGIPGNRASVHIQQEKRIVLNRGRREALVSLAGFHWRGLVVQDQDVAHRQNVAFGGVLNGTHVSIRTQQLEGALLLAVLEKSAPQLRNLGLEAGRSEVVHPAADDLIPRKSQQLAGAGAGIPISAIVVRDQDGRRRMVDDGAEQQLEFPRTVFFEPAGGL